MGFRSLPHGYFLPWLRRTTSDYFQKLAMDIQDLFARSNAIWRTQYPGVETMKLRYGCVLMVQGKVKCQYRISFRVRANHL